VSPSVNEVGRGRLSRRSRGSGEPRCEVNMRRRLVSDRLKAELQTEPADADGERMEFRLQAVFERNESAPVWMQVRPAPAGRSRRARRACPTLPGAGMSR
jgi:hypothetical protein